MSVNFSLLKVKIIFERCVFHANADLDNGDFYSGKYRIDNEEEGKAVESHYFRRDRRVLWSRRHWRIINDVDNEIKMAKKNGTPAGNWCIESSGPSSRETLASLRHRKGVIPSKMRASGQQREKLSLVAKSICSRCLSLSFYRILTHFIGAKLSAASHGSLIISFTISLRVFDSTKKNSYTNKYK